MYVQQNQSTLDLLQVFVFHSTKSDIHGTIMHPPDEWGILCLLSASNSGKKSHSVLI